MVEKKRTRSTGGPIPRKGLRAWVARCEPGTRLLSIATIATPIRNAGAFLFGQWQKLSRCRRGTPILEIAIVTPLFMIMVTGSFDIARFFHQQHVAHRTAHHITDLVSRRSTITTEQLVSIMEGSSRMLTSSANTEQGAHTMIVVSMNRGAPTPIAQGRGAHSARLELLWYGIIRKQNGERETIEDIDANTPCNDGIAGIAPPDGQSIANTIIRASQVVTGSPMQRFIRTKIHVMNESRGRARGLDSGDPNIIVGFSCLEFRPIFLPRAISATVTSPLIVFRPRQSELRHISP